MNKDKKNMYISLMALVIAVVGVTIAYTAYSTSLKVHLSTVTQNKFSWDVKLNSGSVEPIKSTSGSGDTSGEVTSVCGSAVVTDSNVSVSGITLSKPGDKCSYPITTKNIGDVDAVLSSITASAPEGTVCQDKANGTLVCGNITYKLATDVAGLNPLKIGSQKIVKNDGTIDFYLVVSYELASGEEAKVEKMSQTGAGFTLVYTQFE